MDVGLISLDGKFHKCNPNSHQALARKVGKASLETLADNGWLVVEDDRVYSGSNAQINDKQIRQLLHLRQGRIIQEFLDTHPGGFASIWEHVVKGDWEGYIALKPGDWCYGMDYYGSYIDQLTPSWQWKRVFEHKVWDEGRQWMIANIHPYPGFLGQRQWGDRTTLVTRAYYR